jgi:hypothetical protein
MEVNHANQINALQNRLITMERSQNNRPHHKPNDKWPKRPPPHDQRPPNPFESTNLVEHQAIPYCRPCGEFHEETTVQFFLRVLLKMIMEMNKLTCVVGNNMWECMIGWNLPNIRIVQFT